MISKAITVVAAFLTIAALASEHPYGGITFVGTFDIEGIGRVTDHTVWPETYPTQFHARVVLPEGKHLFGYSVSHDTHIRYPLMDESLWFMPPMKAGELMSVEAIVATDQYWVDPNPGKGSDENIGSESAPFATLQRAVNEGSTNAKEYTVIYAAPGNYTTGGATPSNSTKARVVIDRNVRIKGAGRGISFIHGKKDTTSGLADTYGCGPEAERCIQFTSFSDTCVQGFTICNGYSGLSSSATADMKKGGIIAKGVKNHIVDSVVSNCFGYNGTAAYCGSFVRTLITCCDGIPKQTTLTANNNVGLRLVCSIARSRSNSGSTGTAGDATLIQSTVTGDKIDDVNGAYGFRAQTLATNCVLGAGNRSYTTNAGIHGNLIWANSGIVDVFGESNIFWGSRKSGDWTEPLLMDVRADDATPLSISPVIGAGMMYEDYFVTYSPDYNGNPILFVDGKPTLGAIQTTVQALVLPKSAQFATLNIEGATQLTNGVHEGDTVTLTLENPTRPGGSFIVNGNKIPGPSFTFTAGEWNSKEIGNAFEISEVVFDNSWYVDAKYGDDANTGFYPGRGHAKRTLISICTNTSAFIEGDTLHVAPGVYDEGYALTANGCTRCPVEQKRHVVADLGALETFIVGSSSTDETKDSDGCGPGAIRCISLGKNATITGFTLTGGRTDLSTAADGKKSGGCGYNDPESTVFNCIISNNIATGKGAAIRNGNIVNCKIFENANSQNQGILQGVKLYGSVIDKNRSNSLTPESNKIYNSVIGSNNVNYANTASAWCIYWPMQDNIVANTICLGRFGSAAGREIIATNSVFVNYGDSAANFIVLGGSSFITNKGAALLDSNYAPLPEFRKFTVDGGDNSFIFDIYGGNDILGSQRIYNGTIDIGPMEEDFRPVYKTIFAPSAGFTLEYASPLVYASGKTLHVGNGQSIKIKWERSSLRKIKTEVLANVTGNGALKIFSNGKLVATVTKASVNKTVFTINSQISDLVFSFEGDGYASLQNLSSAEQGLVLSFL